MTRTNNQDDHTVSLNSVNLERPIAKMENIPDLMASLAGLDDDTVTRIRKTAESPPRVSVIDVICVITGNTPHDGSQTHIRLCEAYPEVSSICGHFQFSGQGQRNTPVTDATGIVQILWLLPGRAAAEARQSAAKVVLSVSPAEPADSLSCAPSCSWAVTLHSSLLALEEGLQDQQ